MKKTLHNLEDHFCAFILLVMLILTFVNVVARYVFHGSMPFVEELTRLGLMILSIVGAAVAAKRGAHLGLSALTDLLPKKSQKYINLIGDVVASVFCVVIIYYGYFMVVSEYVNNLKTSGMQWPQWIFGIWVAVGGLVMLIRYIQLAVNEFRHNKEGAE